MSSRGGDFEVSESFYRSAMMSRDPGYTVPELSSGPDQGQAELRLFTYLPGYEMIRGESTDTQLPSTL